MKDKIAEILYDELNEVYCSTCDNKDASCDEFGGNFHPCWTCRKEQVNWKLSDKYAEQLAEKILNCIKEVEDKN